METKHTPGPWRAGFESQADRKHTMIVRAEEVDGQPRVAICRSNFGDIPIEENATLIAATPELLDMLLRVRETCHLSEDDTLAGDIDRLLHKAMGGSYVIPAAFYDEDDGGEDMDDQSICPDCEAMRIDCHCKA